MHLLDLIEQELRAYRESGRAIHLARIARALDEVRAELDRSSEGPPLHVDGHQDSRQ